MYYYKPWTSDEKPNIKDLDGWGLAAIQRSGVYFGCSSCGKKIGWQEQYVYSFQNNGTPIRHNTEECTSDLRS
jgi:hypothetical protein